MQPPSTTVPTWNRLLLTGAAGKLGRVLRPRMKPWCRWLRVSDLADLGPLAQGEEALSVALQDRDAVNELLHGVDAVVHMGGISDEAPHHAILQANIVGVYNLYEAARLQGVHRVVFASSNHVTGFYRQDAVITAQQPMRADGHYGLSKAYGENLSRFYFDRYGIETVCLRIGSACLEPTDRRMLSSWLSLDDLERLILASLQAPVVGHTVVYGVSANPASWWDNTAAAQLGYQPQDSAEPYRAALLAKQPSLDLSDPTVLYQGGKFVRRGPF